MDRPGVFVLRELSHGAALKQYLADTRPHRAVIVGAGYVGLEMAEALAGRGLEVAVVERLPRVVPGFEPEIAAAVRGELERQGIRVETGRTVQAIEGRAAGGLCVRTDRSGLSADLVLVSVGVRPEVSLARDAGIALGETGAIAVDERMETSVPDVYAAGDCAEAYHRILARPAWVPLGTTANKQGKVAGANAAGAAERFAGIVGTAGFKVFELEVARTGITVEQAQGAGLDAVRALSQHASRGHGYPGASPLTTVVVAEHSTGRLLGAQMVGASAVATRVGIFATALHAGLSVSDVAELDLAYAPPFAPVYDPVLIAATVARKALAEHAA